MLEELINELLFFPHFSSLRMQFSITFLTAFLTYGLLYVNADLEPRSTLETQNDLKAGAVALEKRGPEFWGEDKIEKRLERFRHVDVSRREAENQAIPARRSLPEPKGFEKRTRSRSSRLDTRDPLFAKGAGAKFKAKFANIIAAVKAAKADAAAPARRDLPEQKVKFVLPEFEKRTKLSRSRSRPSRLETRDPLFAKGAGAKFKAKFANIIAAVKAAKAAKASAAAPVRRDSSEQKDFEKRTNLVGSHLSNPSHLERRKGKLGKEAKEAKAKAKAKAKANAKVAKVAANATLAAAPSANAAPSAAAIAGLTGTAAIDAAANVANNQTSPAELAVEGVQRM
ncbi:uncharacterized protein MELLADRAFT_86724 [Melampsora larici-populina 98AG31]|uniref:Uncharacterized protein n=1 Tax=Melampsora larici-populina (strain 98AG31 / pathotype 3-4-7) TaxID=747676 RepID=F4R356_MELLP|nr:uncharacterized protein MELLADRAFT_86724 [Melampsora larici-populina 98AG31]EGG12570.1 hypothetical protein MELLADRAFT_86724 [Melampsora larici-populina 98AG31]